MKQIKNVNLEVKVFIYDTKEEMKEHVALMANEKWEVKYQGEVFVSKKHNFTEWEDPYNWRHMAEFSRVLVENSDDGCEYDTVSYIF